MPLFIALIFPFFASFYLYLSLHNEKYDIQEGNSQISASESTSNFSKTDHPKSKDTGGFIASPVSVTFSNNSPVLSQKLTETRPSLLDSNSSFSTYENKGFFTPLEKEWSSLFKDIVPQNPPEEDGIFNGNLMVNTRIERDTLEHPFPLEQNFFFNNEQQSEEGLNFVSFIQQMQSAPPINIFNMEEDQNFLNSQGETNSLGNSWIVIREGEEDEREEDQEAHIPVSPLKNNMPGNTFDNYQVSLIENYFSENSPPPPKSRSSSASTDDSFVIVEEPTPSSSHATPSDESWGGWWPFQK